MTELATPCRPNCQGHVTLCIKGARMLWHQHQTLSKLPLNYRHTVHACPASNWSLGQAYTDSDCLWVYTGPDCAFLSSYVSCTPILTSPIWPVYAFIYWLVYCCMAQFQCIPNQAYSSCMLLAFCWCCLALPVCATCARMCHSAKAWASLWYPWQTEA